MVIWFTVQSRIPVPIPPKCCGVFAASRCASFRPATSSSRHTPTASPTGCWLTSSVQLHASSPIACKTNKMKNVKNKKNITKKRRKHREKHWQKMGNGESDGRPPSSYSFSAAACEAMLLLCSLFQRSRYSAVFFDNVPNSWSICCRFIRCATRISVKLAANSLVDETICGASPAMLTQHCNYLRFECSWLNDGRAQFS